MSVIGQGIVVGGQRNRKAEGEYTIATAGNIYTVTITHNLHTRSLLFVLQRLNSDGSPVVETYRYRLLAAVIASPVIDGQDLLNQTQKYQYTTSGTEVTVQRTSLNDSWNSGFMRYFAAADGTTLGHGISQVGGTNYGIIAQTDDTLTFNSTYAHTAGRYVWRVYAI